MFVVQLGLLFRSSSASRPRRSVRPRRIPHPPVEREPGQRRASRPADQACIPPTRSSSMIEPDAREDPQPRAAADRTAVSPSTTPGEMTVAQPARPALMSRKYVIMAPSRGRARPARRCRAACRHREQGLRLIHPGWCWRCARKAAGLSAAPSSTRAIRPKAERLLVIALAMAACRLPISAVAWRRATTGVGKASRIDDPRRAAAIVAACR